MNECSGEQPIVQPVGDLENDATELGSPTDTAAYSTESDQAAVAATYDLDSAGGGLGSEELPYPEPLPETDTGAVAPIANTASDAEYAAAEVVIHWEDAGPVYDDFGDLAERDPRSDEGSEESQPARPRLREEVPEEGVMLASDYREQRTQERGDETRSDDQRMYNVEANPDDYTYRSAEAPDPNEPDQITLDALGPLGWHDAAELKEAARAFDGAPIPIDINEPGVIEDMFVRDAQERYHGARQQLYGIREALGVPEEETAVSLARGDIVLPDSVDVGAVVDGYLKAAKAKAGVWLTRALKVVRDPDASPEALTAAFTRQRYASNLQANLTYVTDARNREEFYARLIDRFGTQS